MVLTPILESYKKTIPKLGCVTKSGSSSRLLVSLAKLHPRQPPQLSFVLK